MSNWHELQGNRTRIAVNLARAISIERGDSGTIIYYGNGDRVTVDNDFDEVIGLAGVLPGAGVAPPAAPAPWSEKDPYSVGGG